MKKIVALLICFSALALCGCAQSSSGYVCELTQSRWSAELDGGAVVSLSFDEDTASLNIENGGKSTSISGKYIADDSTLVIFVPELAQNYGFEYVPKGSTLELSYGGNSINLKRSD